MLLFALSTKDEAFSGRLWPAHPTLSNFALVFEQKNYWLNHFWLQLWNSLLIAVAVGAITLFVATGAAFAISRLKVKGGRLVMNLALFTYFIPAAFLAVPMYKAMGTYGLLNTQWALILAMITLASPYAIWVLKQASDKLPVELDEAARIDGASPLQLFRLVYVPLMTPSLVAVGTYALLLAWNEYLYAFLLLSRDTDITLAVALGHFLSADDSPWELLMTTGIHLRAAAGGDLLRVQALHGLGPHRRRGEVLSDGASADSMASVSFRNIEKAYGSHQGHPRHLVRDQRRRVHGAGRPVGLRQVDAAADAGGARGRSPAARSRSTPASSTTSSPRTATSRWCSRATRCTRT